MQTKLTDEQVKYLAGHPDCIPAIAIEYFLKGYRAGEAAGALQSIYALPNKNGGVDCDVQKGPCACGAWH